MQEQRILIFEPFCLDVGNERLWRVQEVLHLTHKAFAVLHYLAEHAGQLVTKDALLEVVWSQTSVGEAALAVCIREIRRALGDQPRTPRFVATVHGRGYRFLAPVTIADRLPASPPLPVLPSPPPLLVGREAECAQMQQWWARAVQGERQEAGYGTQVREIAAALAVHFERGRDPRRAVQYLWQAGSNALQRSAHREAIIHLTRGLALLQTLPDTPERLLHELVLQASLGTPLIATKGWAAPEVATAYRRAQALWERLGETPQYCWVLYGLCAWHAMRAEWQTARALMERLLTLAKRVHHPTLLMHAHLGLGGILYCLGAFAGVRAHIEQGLALYDPQTHTPAVSDAVHDPEVVGRCCAAGALWHLGYPEQARQHLDAALTRAQELAHPFTLAQVFYCATTFALVRREVQVARERADALITLATAQGFPFQLASGMLCRGLVLIEQGQQEEGMRQIQQGLAAHRATGAAAGQPYALAFLARAYGQDGQSNKGRQVLGEALTLVHRTGERCYEAELYRLKGELLLQEGKSPKAQSLEQRLAEAEQSFRQALAVARSQQAKTLELRAAMSLGRLWQQQGRRSEARRLLAEVYGWFTEGFDTADLQEAKALLEALS